jgi:hypothetical protein
MMAADLLIVLGAYMACGLIFALPFVLFGAGLIDPHATHGSWGFRIMIIPGAIALWPLLLRRWISGAKVPPEERSAHRIPQSGIRHPQSV